jgi:hypothetical protein
MRSVTINIIIASIVNKCKPLFIVKCVCVCYIITIKIVEVVNVVWYRMDVFRPEFDFQIMIIYYNDPNKPEHVTQPPHLLKKLRIKI